MSALLVAAMTMMPVLPSKPSISVRSWFSRLLALIIASANSSSTGAANSVNLIHKDNAGCVSPLPCTQKANEHSAVT